MITTLSWRNIWRNKRRSLITMASVFFAVIFSTLLSGMKEGMYDQMIKSTVYSSVGYVQVQERDYKEEKSIDYALEYDDALVERIRSHNGVQDVVPRIETFSLASRKDQLKPVQVTGIDPKKEQKHYGFRDRVKAGDYIDEGSPDILVATGLAERMGLAINDTLVLLGMGYHGTNAAGKYRISGIVRPKNPQLNNNGVFMTLENAQYYVGAPQIATGLLVMIDEEDHKYDVQKTLSRDLNTRYEVYAWPELAPQIEQMIEADRVEGYIFMGIMYFIVSFVIFGTIVMLMAERTREFAIMLAVGMRRMKIGISVLVEMVITTLLGAISGLGAAYIALIYFHLNPLEFADDMAAMFEDYGFEPIITTSVDISIAIQQAVIVSGISCVLALYAFYKLIRLNMVKTITSR